MRGLELHRPQAVVADAEPGHPNYGVFTAQPFERGWGVTIGNALRRILLSSTEGAAVVAVRFAGVDHEYDSIPGVMEDVKDVTVEGEAVRQAIKKKRRYTHECKERSPHRTEHPRRRIKSWFDDPDIPTGNGGRGKHRADDTGKLGNDYGGNKF